MALVDGTTGECETIKNETSSCNGCVGKDSEMPYLQGYGVHNRIMIIGDRVTHAEKQNGEVFTGAAAKFLALELHNIGVDITECYLTKVVKCYQADTPKKAVVDNCFKLLEQEIDLVKPDYILTLGALPMRLLCKTTLKRSRGTLLHYKGAKVIGTINPSLVINKPSESWQFRADLEYFANTLQGWEHPNDFVLDTECNLEEIRDAMLYSDAISYDIETTGLDEHAKDAKILMIGIATRTKTFILPVDETTIPFLQEVLGKDTPYQKVATNAKFDNRWLRSVGITPEVTFDTYLAAYLWNVNIPHGLKYLAKTYLGASDYDKGIVFKPDLTNDELEAMEVYCGLDCYYALKLYDFLKEKLTEDVGLWNVFRYIVMPGEKVLQRIEHRGVYVDQDRLDKVQKAYEEKLVEIDNQINHYLPAKYKTTGINLNSSKQLAELLYDDLKLPCDDFTPKGARATGRSVLLKLVDKHPIPQLILKRRKHDKAIVGFLEPWREFLKRDGRLHSTYNIARTATGRLSADSPNLQQVPRDGNVRSLVCAPPGKVFIEADYSQIELRIAAFVANARSMKDAYTRGEDLHTKTAASIARVTQDKVTKQMRNAAKAVNFGFLYGMWWKSFKSYAFDSYGVVVTEKEAEHSRNAYFQTYPELAIWHKRQKEFVQKYKFVRTATGRIRHLPDIDSPDRILAGGAERQAINTVVQSFASDITMLAMILIDKNLHKLHGDKAYIVGQVHDSILVEADADVGEKVADLVKYCMENVPSVLENYFGIVLDLPIEADVSLGTGWGQGF